MENIKIKNLLNIVGGLVIILLIIIFILGFFKIDEVNKMTEKKQQEIEESYRYHGETIKENVIVPNEVANFFAEYNGEYSSIEIYTNFSTLLKDKIPQYCEWCQSDNIESIYKSNRSDIKYWLGCAKQDEFMELINNINKQMNFEKFEIETYSFNPKTVFDGKTTNCNVIVKYKDKNNNIKEFKINIELFENVDDTLFKVSINN